MTEYDRSRHRFGLAASAATASRPAQRYEAAIAQNDVAAVAQPGDSTILIAVDPDDVWSMAQLQVISFREELLHGQRQQFGLMRNVRLLKQRAGEAVYDAFLGDRDPADALDLAAEQYRVLDQLFERIRYPLEQVDKFLAYSLLNDEEHIEREVDIMAASTDAPNSYRRTIREAVESFDLEANTPDRADFIYDSLVDVEERHDRVTAEVVADAALDIPFLIEPLVHDEYPTRPLDSVDLEGRFEEALAHLDRVRNDETLRSPEAMNRDELLETLKRGLQDELGAVSRPKSLRDISLPLLDVPLEATDSDDDREESWAAWNTHGDSLSRILHGSFSFSGGFGGALYRVSAEEKRWLVNPAIRDEPVVWRGDEWTYHRLWSHSFVLDGLIRQLLASVPPSRIRCPLCRHTSGRRCGGAECGASEYVREAKLMVV